MDSFRLFILGAIQGITELLPVSSTGHILIFAELLKLGDISSSLLVLFHLGTTLAILFFLGKKLFRGFFTKKKWGFYLKVFVATIPTSLIGFFFEDILSKKLRATWEIAIALILWGIVMILLERTEKKRKVVTFDLEKITWRQAILTGMAQTVALIPGTSRSGITTIAGILTGMEKYLALEFSFILSIPVLMGSFVWYLIKNPRGNPLFLTGISSPICSFVIIISSSFLFGLLSLVLIKKVKKKNWLTLFGIYRIVLGIIILLTHI